MWEDYRDQYRLRARVLSISRVTQELSNLRRYRLLLIDESHNLRNRDGKRYRAIQEYIQENESRVILLSATPYNKTYLDLANQLRLFVPEDKDLGIRPERLLRELGETEFIRRHQCTVRSLAAFEKSEYADDWREPMRLYLVRRTRSFIQEHYAETDPATGRKFLTFEDGTPSYFPARMPKTLKFKIDDTNPADQYARLYADDVVETINSLALPRYGLGNYIAASPHEPPTQAESRVLQNLSRAGKRLMGFCRTNLFKRLESGGPAFLQSIERHILRNHVFLHAIENNQPLPIGPQDAGLLDARINDADEDMGVAAELFFTEKSGILDGDADTEVDLASYAYQIWKNAITRDPSLQKIIPELPPVCYSTRTHQPSGQQPEGVLVYLRTAEGNDALAWIDKDSNSVTESQFTILQAAECPPDTPALPRLENHHDLVQKGIELIVEEEKTVGGQLGRPSGARFRTYERLKRYAEEVKGTLFESQELLKAIDDLYRYPLRQSAVDTLNRQLRSGISDETLAQLVIALRDEDRLCLVHEEEQEQAREPRIICSMGLSATKEGE